MMLGSRKIQFVEELVKKQKMKVIFVKTVLSEKGGNL